jgi:hypothetical protein
MSAFGRKPKLIDDHLNDCFKVKSAFLPLGDFQLNDE